MYQPLPLKCTLTALLVLTAAPLLAADEETLFLGVQAADFQYEEPGLMEENGGFIGGQIDIDSPLNRSSQLSLDGELLLGRTDYDGQTWGGTPVEATTSDWIARLEGRYLSFRQAPVSPAIGLGVRHWEQNLGGAGGYRRSHTYYYVPLGVRIGSGDPERLLRPTLYLGYRGLLGGTVKSQLSDVHPSNEDAENNLTDGYGLVAELSSTFRVNDRLWHLALVARYWEMEPSELESVEIGGTRIRVYEPYNETRMIGLQVGVAL